MTIAERVLIGGSGSCGEEGVNLVENFRAGIRVMNCVAQFRAVADSVSEQAGELFHFADGVGHFGRKQAAEISAQQVVAVEIGGFIVTASGDVIRDLAKNPGI